MEFPPSSTLYTSPLYLSHASLSCRYFTYPAKLSAFCGIVFIFLFSKNQATARQPFPFLHTGASLSPPTPTKQYPSKQLPNEQNKNTSPPIFSLTAPNILPSKVFPHLSFPSHQHYTKSLSSSTYILELLLQTPPHFPKQYFSH